MPSNMEEVRYLGPNKIGSVVVLDEKTIGGNDIVQVNYEAPELDSERYTKAVFEQMVTNEPKDYNWLREHRYKKLILDLTTIALENDIRYADIKYVATELANKMDAAFERATNFLWTRNDKAWIPGINSLSDRTLMEADKILREIKSNGTGDEEKANT